MPHPARYCSGGHCRCEYTTIVSSAMPSFDWFEHHADVLVMRDHHVVIVTLAALALVLRSAVGAEVHAGRVVPHKERRVRRVRLVDEAQRVCRHFVIDGLHPFLRQRPSVLDTRPSAQQWRTPRGPNRFLNAGSFG